MKHFIFSPPDSFRPAFSVLFFCCIFFSAGLHSQNEKKLVIHFESDSYELTEQSKTSIDSLIKKCDPNPASCKVSVVGFTDNTGDYNYNQQLSENRSKATVDYFKSKGFARTTYSGKSSSNAIGDNATEFGKFENRRVEITISKEAIKVDRIGGIEGKYNASHVNAENGGVIKEPSGTTIQIPANAFVDKSGTAVKGEVDLVYYEYRDPIDFILGNIPMNFMVNGNSQPFNSGGMFKVLAYQDGQQVYLQQGKNIDMNFAATQNVPNLNFYKFDTLANKWIMLNKITDGKGMDVNLKPDTIKKPVRIYNFYGNVQTCTMDPFQQMFFVANAGPKYAQRNGSLQKDLLLSDSVKLWTDKYKKQIGEDRMQINKNNAAWDSMQSQPVITAHQYKLKFTNKEKDKSTFIIRCTSSTENEFAPLRRIAWQMDPKSHVALTDSLFKKKWDNCNIQYDPASVTFTIALSDSSGDANIVLENVKMIFLDKVKKKDRVKKTNFYFSNYASADSSYLAQMARARKVAQGMSTDNTDLLADIDVLNTKIQDLKSNKLIDRDSLYCFWASGKEFMESDVEKDMAFEDWLGYFDQHKTDMFTRYSGIPNTNTYKVARENEMNGNPVAKNGMRNPANAQQGNELQTFMTIGGGESTLQKGESIAETKEVFKSLSISSLGVYNCDQVSRLSAPVVNINATYTNEKNEPLDIILIYVVDESFNGILRYDGLSNMKPSYFPVSGASKNTLIAFDENFQPYIFTSEEFSKIDLTGGVITQTFVMKKMTGLKEKDDLQKQLATK